MLSVLFGIVVSCNFFHKSKKNVIWVLGGILGLYIGRLISFTAVKFVMNTFADSNRLRTYVIVTTWGITILGLSLGLTLSSRYKSFLSRVGTALIGSYAFVRGLETYVENFPDGFKLESFGDFEFDNFKPDDSQAYYTWGYITGFVVLFIVGACFQYWKWPTKKRYEEDEDDDEYTYMEGDDDDDLN